MIANIKKNRGQLFISLLLFFLMGNPIFSQEWEWKSPPNSDNPRFSSVYPISETKIIAVGQAIWKSEDGGESWIEIPKPSIHNYVSVWFIDENRGWLLGIEYNFPNHKGILLETNDGGNTWNTIFDLDNFDFGANTGVGANNIFFISKNIGWVSLGDAGLLKTIDGGLTWSNIHPNPINPIYRINFVNEEYGWALSDYDSNRPAHQIVLITEDGGNTWFREENPETSGLDIFFVNEKIGFVSGWIPHRTSARNQPLRTLYKTEDGGRTWKTPDEIPNIRNKNGIYFINEDTGWIIGDKIYKTTNSGLTWQLEEENIGTGIDITFFDNSIGWVVGSQGSILKLDLNTPNPPNGCRQQDSLILADFYKNRNGINWTYGAQSYTDITGQHIDVPNKNNKWDLNSPIDTWYGVELNEAGCVKTLVLNNCRINGTIPSSLGGLSNLEYLGLAVNQFSGNIPKELGKLENLQSLDLSVNQFSGNIPADLGNLIKLNGLYLIFCGLTGEIPSTLGNLSNLEWLRLANNNIEGNIPASLGNLSNLQYLELDRNQLTGNIPSEFGQLGNLIKLELSTNDLTDTIPNALANINGLEQLLLDDNRLNGSIPPELGNLNSIKYIDLSDNDLEGCFAENLKTFCAIGPQMNPSPTGYKFSGNSRLPDNGNFEAFCENGTGSCSNTSDLNFCLTDSQGSPNATITVPIQITNFENISSFQFKLKVDNASVVTIKNVKDGALSGTVFFKNADDTYSLAWFDANGVGVSLPDSSIILELEIELAGDNNDCTDINFSDIKAFQNGQEIIANNKKGEVCIAASLTKSGTIANFKGFPILNVSVDCNGIEQISTGSDGFYEFTNISGGNNYTITPSKELECNQACINIADYAAIDRHIARTVPLTSPYELIAADVSGDGNIDDSDLDLIFQMIGFARPAIDQFPVGAWKFVPKNYTFPNQTNPFSPAFPEKIELTNLQNDALNQDFVVIKVGDIAITNTASYRTNQSLIFEVKKINTLKGDQFDFYCSNLDVFTSFQLSLEKNNHLLIPPKLMSSQLEQPLFLGISAKNIQLAWFTPYPNKEMEINPNQPIFSVLFPGINKKDSKIEVNQKPNTTLAFNSENKAFPIILKQVGADNTENELVLLPNTPNPFHHTTKLRFYLPENNQVTVSIFDYSGQEIYKLNNVLEKGYQEITLEDVLPKANGIYLYQIRTNKASQFGKMIRL